MLSDRMNWLLWVAILVGCHEVTTEDNIPLCKTQNEEAAYCVPLYWCPHLLQALALSKPSVIDFYERSKCGDYKVCCGTWTTINSFNYINNNPVNTTGEEDYVIPKKLNETITSNRNYVIKNILPTTRYCGLQHTDDRIYTKSSTALDEVPWLVNFKISHHAGQRGRRAISKYQTYCAGVLISNQHVLTSSYCSWKRFFVWSVILGLYHPRENATCDEDPFLPECTDPAVEIPIERVLVLGDSNLVLYKLKKKVTYSDYIRPICLPFNQTTRPMLNETVTTSGWGDRVNGDAAKKRIRNVLVPNDECSQVMEKSLTAGSINKHYAMCTKIEENSTVAICGGDQGGPFTYTYKHQWFLEGIINGIHDEDSNTRGPCSKNKYLFGEKITLDVLNWILDAIYYLDKVPQ